MFSIFNTPFVPISKHPFIRGNECLHTGTEGVLKLFEKLQLN